MSDQRDIYLERLSKIDGILWISDETWGYGVSGTAYFLTDEGFYGGISHDGYAPEVITKEEYEEALKIINSEDFDENEYYGEAVEMVKVECKPDIEYYTDFGGYMTKVENEEIIAEAVMESVFTPWDELDTEELEEWCSILDEIKKVNLVGIT